jgi:hypothetical protein
MRRTQDSIDRITQADLSYFERFPHRRHRVRVAGRAEIERVELLGIEQHYTVIRKLSPDTCLSLVILGPPDADPELFEEGMARLIFEHNAAAHGQILVFANMAGELE